MRAWCIGFLLLGCTGPAASELPASAGEPVRTTRFAVSGMTCGGCADAITQTLEREPGVVSVLVSFETESADVAHRGRTPAELAAVIESLGYEARPVDSQSAPRGQAGSSAPSEAARE